jgi:3D-(3,5/4)-trihydroxycyclohexane-1,2-dione acylhydrolase (decyclizing)
MVVVRQLSKPVIIHNGFVAPPLDCYRRLSEAESMGALARKVEGLSKFGHALDWAKTTGHTTFITIVSDAFTWTLGDALWGVGVPQVSKRGEVNEAAKYQVDVRK